MERCQDVHSRLRHQQVRANVHHIVLRVRSERHDDLMHLERIVPGHFHHALYESQDLRITPARPQQRVELDDLAEKRVFGGDETSAETGGSLLQLIIHADIR